MLICACTSGRFVKVSNWSVLGLNITFHPNINERKKRKSMSLDEVILTLTSPQTVSKINKKLPLSSRLSDGNRHLEQESRRQKPNDVIKKNLA
jgi:hypothetical protein